MTRRCGKNPGDESCDVGIHYFGLFGDIKLETDAGELDTVDDDHFNFCPWCGRPIEP